MFLGQIFDADHNNTVLPFVQMSNICVWRYEGTGTSECQDIGVGTFRIPTTAMFVNPIFECTSSTDNILTTWDNNWYDVMLSVLSLTVLTMFRGHEDYTRVNILFWYSRLRKIEQSLSLTVPSTNSFFMCFLWDTGEPWYQLLAPCVVCTWWHSTKRSKCWSFPYKKWHCFDHTYSLMHHESCESKV